MDISQIDRFVEYFEKVRSRTRRVVLVIPREAIEFRPRPEMFSLGDLVRHIAGTERYLFIENVLGKPSSYPGHALELANGFEATLSYFDRLHAESLALLGGLSPADLEARRANVGGVSMPAWKWLRAMVEHEVHHRGQIYVLLALLGVKTPPLYGLTEPEVLERSIGYGR